MSTGERVRKVNSKRGEVGTRGRGARGRLIKHGVEDVSTSGGQGAMLQTQESHA